MAGYKRIKNAQADVPDTRDWIYQPTLMKLKDFIDPDVHTRRSILDQKSEGACTGFALAGAINILHQRSGRKVLVSPRMLYEMAKRNDEWPGEAYDGSSLRGAIHGWKNMGVCEDQCWPYRVGNKKGSLTIDAAKNARNYTLGAYYRLKPVISHFHAALTEVGVIVVSAKIHKGWDSADGGIIEQFENTAGGHAFIIVGYNEKGFWIQNSWGKGWGDNGVALWTYEDWIKNVMDAWVFQLSIPTPQIFGMRAFSSRLATTEAGKVEKSPIPRAKIAGHFVHIDDGAYMESGRYWSSPEDIEQTAELAVTNSKYDHILVYAHGGLNSPEASAKRIAAMKNVYKKNGIYPFHVMYDTGVAEELKDLIFRKETDASERTGGFSDWTDRFIEGLLRRPGTLLWEEMKKDAQDAFAREGAGTDALGRFIKHIRSSGRKVKLHLVGHSTGAVVIAHLLTTLRRSSINFETCSLMAPACTVDLYHDAYLPVLKKKAQVRLGDMVVYNLKDELELDDNVGQIYRKSLLYLVSNSFERSDQKPLLGMEKFVKQVTTVRSMPQFIYSNGVEGKRTRSTTHGGFDNDVYTMNHILRRVMGSAPIQPFTEENLSY
jgi:pimeloyl-ACP methyl ester carboxylesterase